MIYFDNNATTPVAPEVRDAMLPFLTGSFGNASSSYELGREARTVVDRSRESVASLLGASDPGHLAFTSCGTESDNWAVLGALDANPGKKHIISTAVEHDAVRKVLRKLELSGFDVTWLDVDRDGELDLEQLESSLNPNTALVTVMLANNETGILFPVNEIAAIVKERSDALFHVDGVNAVGKVPIDLKSTEIDLFSISAHKFHGPKGIGALYIRSGVQLRPSLIGGGQEGGRRAGTEAVHQIAGIGAAARLAADLSPMETVKHLRDRLENEILNRIPNSRLNGTADPAKRLPNTSSISFENTNGEMILHGLDRAGICVSTGSACNAADHTASPVLAAMDIPYSWAMGSIRFSLNRFNTDQDVETVVAVLPEIVSNLRSLSGAAV
jgi:cysteine desulfurase